MIKIESVTLEGFKSFADEPPSPSCYPMCGAGQATNKLAFGNVTVLIGANGAGKSTVTSFFDMLNHMTTDSLQLFIQRQGGGSSLLHFGPKRTPTLRARLEFSDIDNERTSAYEISMVHAAPDRLVYNSEVTEYRRPEWERPQVNNLGSGHIESKLKSSADSGDNTSGVIYNTLCHYRSFHFHDTSDSSKIRNGGYIDDCRYLRHNAGNLAAFLYSLRHSEHGRSYYERIVNTFQLAFPHLRTFSLEPSGENNKYVRLNWYSREDNEYLLGPHQFSDGALRFLALTTLLRQPPEFLPQVIVLDEPELGLHPHAIGLLAEMLHSAGTQSQVLVATQSPVLLDYFELPQVRPIVNHRGSTIILELDHSSYVDWIQEYTTGDLWQKNIISGGIQL